LKSFGEIIVEEGRVPSAALQKVGSHMPRIEAPERVRRGKVFELRIEVSHSNSVEHGIRCIDIYLYDEGREFNPIHVAHVELEPPYSVPRVSIAMRLEKTCVIYVVVYCNLHGVWVSRKRIEVVES